MKVWIALFVGLLLGAIGGAGGMLFAYPFLFPPPPVMEKAPESATMAPAASFKFDETSPGRDAVHWANGSGRVYSDGAKTVVRLEDDFVAGPGPNYWIYLNTKPVGDEGTFRADQGRVKIAPLKSFKGGQNYTLPETVQIADYAALTIWCETFAAFISTAPLPRPAAKSGT